MLKLGKRLALFDAVTFLEVKTRDSTGGASSNARLPTGA